MAARELDVAVGADQQQARVGKLTRDELEQEQRSLVGPVQVVQDEHEGPASDSHSSGSPRSSRRGESGLAEDRRGRKGLPDPAAAGARRGRARRRRQHPCRAPREAARGRGSRTQERSACTHGQYGGAPSASQQRPQSTSAPLSAARLASSSARRLLPMPGSPPTTSEPSAAGQRVARARARSVASSRSRPTKTLSGRLEGRRRRRCAAEGLVTAGREEVESGILTENRLLELDDRPARLEAELVDEHAARVLVDLQGLGLAAAAIQGEHQLPA